jgi:serine/threonine protein kinase
MNLAEWLKQRHTLGEELQVMESLCVAIEAAHKREVLHRGLEPSTIEVTDGKARPAPAASAPSSSRGYLAPEVRDGGEHTPRSDVFATGVIFYEILTKKHPFVVETASGSLETVLNLQPPPLRDVVPELPHELADAITACLERDPEWRPGDLSYLSQVIQNLLASPAVQKGAAKKARAAEPKPLPVARKKTARGGFPVLRVLGVLALAAAAGAWFFLRSQGPSTPPPPSFPPASVPPSLATPEPSESPTATADEAKPSPRASAEPSPPSSAEPSPAPSTQPSLAPPPTQPSPVASPPPPPPPSPTPAPLPQAVVTLPAPPLPSPEAPPTPATPASLATVSPKSAKRSSTVVLDVHGAGLKRSHQARFLRGREVAPGVTIVRQRFVSPILLQVIIQVDETAAPGIYSLSLTDSDGTLTNSLPFDISK